MTGDKVTVKDAAHDVERDISRVYAWVREQRLSVWEDRDGITYVSLAEVRELEGRMNRRRNNKTRRLAD